MIGKACTLLFCLILIAFIHEGQGQLNTLPQSQWNCNGQPNNLPVWDQPPTFVSQVKNGKLYKAGGDQVSPQINLLHLWGTPYEMGYAAGQLTANILPQFIAGVYADLDAAIAPFVKTLPVDLQQLVENNGTAAALQLTFDLCKPYIEPWYIEELQGWADGSGASFQQLLHINMLPELVQAACSMFGAWGEAIAKTSGTLIQLRALDWNTNSVAQQQPTVVVYHPNSGNGHAFANVAWLGFIGSLSGFSSAPVAICEKVWIHYTGVQNRAGYPWTFLLRDILQYDIDIDSALTRIANAKRTCSIFAGVGSGLSNTFKIVEYAYEAIQIFNDRNFPAYPNHPLMDGLVWVDKHTQPSGDPCMTQLLEYYYGSITAEVTLRNITAQFQTGDTQVVVYDYAANNIYVSNCAVWNPATGAAPAYDRQFTKFDMTAMWNEQPPVF